MSPLDKWIAVVVATLNPLTGRAIAIPLGAGMGLPAVWVCVVAGVSNFVLAAAIVLLIERVEHIGPVRRFIERKRGKRLARFVQGKGLGYAVVLGPLLLGTFTVILVFQALGADKKRMLVYSLLSAILLTPLIGWTSLQYKNVLEELVRSLGAVR